MLSKRFILSSICILTGLFLIFSSGIFASELVDPAAKYKNADLIILGSVFSCTTIVTEQNDTPGADGWINHMTKLMNICTVKVDSLIKGSLTDSIIKINNESSQTYYWAKIFVGLDEKGDSSFMGQAVAMQPNDEGAGKIPGAGKFILALVEKEATYTSILCCPYDQNVLGIFKQVKEKGENYFKLPKPSEK